MDTEILELGKNISGGQAQKIAVKALLATKNINNG